MTSAVSDIGMPKPTDRTAIFDPFADLMLMQEEKPHDWQPVDLRSITPFQRALLSMDGTVTKFLEAYTLEPIKIIQLQQQQKTLMADHPGLEAPIDTPVIARQVLLCGKHSAKVYAYAVSLLITDRLPTKVLQELDREPAGLGRVLCDSQLENRREVLWYGREHMADLPEAISTLSGQDFISRTYRIIVDQNPTILVNEKFPVICPVTGC